MRSIILTPLQLLLVVAISTLLITKSQTTPGDATPLDIGHTPSLRVITTESFHNYQNNNGKIDGLSYQLIATFAENEQKSIDIILAKNSDEVYQALDQGLADIGLLDSPTSISRNKHQRQSLPYMQTTTELIYRHGTGTPKTFEELSEKTIVIHNSEHLREKMAFIASHYPEINWQLSDLSSRELLEQLNKGMIDYTLSDSHEFISLRAIYTQTRSAFPIYYPEALSIAFADHTSETLSVAFNQHLEHIKADGSLKHLIERFYGHSADSNPRGSHTFFARVNSRLPKYQSLIKTIAEEFQIDWRLLAAIAYQESHWDPLAKSPTGVRGMMMLTQQTAKELGVKNRLDTEQSLRGGAAYLKSLMMRLPAEIQQPDRTWLALASYNIGIGHVLDVFEITEFHGGNKYRWSDVKKYLPLLEKQEWHQFTRYGYARGKEPVGYVQNIRHFNDLLEWRFPIEASAPSPTSDNIKVFDELVSDAEMKSLDPEHGPVRLSSLIAGTDI